MSDRVGLYDFPDIPDRSALDDDPDRNGRHEPAAIVVQTLLDFAETDEPTAAAILGDSDENIVSVDGVLLMYGDGGAGKTTLSVDALAHFASGTEWLGLPVAEPVRTLIIENEGSRGPFRRRLRSKITNWGGAQFHPNVHIVEDPWATMNLALPAHRQAVAEAIDHTNSDMLVMGPLATLGAKGGGRPDDVSEFEAVLSDLRSRTQRPFAMWIVHHENKQGDVSGAWERFPQTMVHVQSLGHGHTKLHWRKARYASSIHGTSTNLTWTDNHSYEVETDPNIGRDFPSELLDAFGKDNQWRTIKEARSLVTGNESNVLAALQALVDRRDFEYAVGPAGRRPNSKCWRLREQTLEDDEFPF